jgi:hypothetical protein
MTNDSLSQVAVVRFVQSPLSRGCGTPSVCQGAEIDAVSTKPICCTAAEV